MTTQRDAAGDQPAAPNATHSDSVIRRFVYVNAAGEPIYRKIRRPGKRTHLERYEDGRWISKLKKDTLRPLYNLPRVMEAAAQHRIVWFTEGESDAEALIAEGLTATTTGGVTSWQDRHALPLRGVKMVMLCYDHDEADEKTGKRDGHVHAWKVAQSLRAHGVKFKFLRSPYGKDVREHLESGHALDELERVAPEGGPLSVVPSPANGPLEAHSGVFDDALELLTEHAAKLGRDRPLAHSDDAGYECICPAHDDHKRSLGIKPGNKHPIVVFCQAGCEPADIARALGMRYQDFSDHEEGGDREGRVRKRVEDMRIEQEARAIVNHPPEPFSLPSLPSIDDYLDKAPEGEDFAIQGLATRAANVTIVAVAKVGKTTLVGNLKRSFADELPFLDRFETDWGDGRIHFLDLEMDGAQYATWLRRQDIRNRDRLVTPWHVRENGINPLHWPEEYAAWLGSREVAAWVIDSGARAQADFVQNGISSSEVLRFQDRIDDIKRMAGIRNVFVILHGGATEGDTTRARDSTRWQDWPDAIWMLNKDDRGVRKLSATGRGVDVEPLELTHDKATDHIRVGGTYAEREREDSAGVVTDALVVADRKMTRGELDDAVSSEHRKGVTAALDRGWIEKERAPGPNGGNATWYWATEVGRGRRNVSMPGS